SLAAHFANATCERGQRCLYVTFEESPSQLARNMRTIGLDLQHWLDAGLLRIDASRPSTYGHETHLAMLHKAVESHRPDVVIVDPITNFAGAHSRDAYALVLRLVDFLKSRGITA